MSKKVLMVMPVMKGGGAEKVAARLLNQLNKNGYDCSFLLTSCDSSEVVNCNLDPSIPIEILREKFENNPFKMLMFKVLRLFSSLFCKVFEVSGINVPWVFAYFSFVCEYNREIKALRNRLKDEPQTTVISFLQPSIPITLIACKNLKNNVVISERGDPKRLMKKRYGYKFIKKFYNRADKIVFQTEDALNTYPPEFKEKGVVIFNPLGDDLPPAYEGERNLNITTFCRISRQKNLLLLCKAFNIVHKEFPQYTLKIVGGTQNSDDELCLEEVKAYLTAEGLEGYTQFFPFSKNVLEEICMDAVYVNSSDYEGMSNAMLESMAIGMPVVCTDCPIGGAAAVIKDGENGLLVPVGDYKKLAEAIKYIISDGDFSSKLSRNAMGIRKELALENIAKKWMEIL